MRILYASPAYKPAYNYGGPVHSVSALAETLVRKGHQVTVISTNGNGHEDLDCPLDQPVIVEGVEVWYFRREEPIQKYLAGVDYLAKSIGFMYAPNLKRELPALVGRADVVHTQLPFNYPTLAVGRAALAQSKPLFMNQRGDYDPVRLRFRGLKKRVYIRLFEMPLLRKASGLIALTGREEWSYRQLGLKNPVSIVPNGIDVEKFRTASSETIGFELGWKSSDPVVLFLARFHHVKGADRLIKAFILVANEIPDLKLVMAGPDEHGLTEVLQNLLEAAGLANRVLFPGAVTGEAKLNLLARADLFCLPSDSEGFSMAVLEALASNTPVLLSPGCYFPEVEAAGAGKVVPATPEAIAEGLRSLLASQQRKALSTMSSLAGDLVRGSYTWDRVSEKLLSLYSSACAQGPL